MEIIIYNNCIYYRYYSFIISCIFGSGNVIYILYNISPILHINIVDNNFYYFIIILLWIIVVQFIIDFIKFCTKKTTNKIENINCYFKIIHLFNIVFLVYYYNYYNNKLDNIVYNSIEYNEYNNLKYYCLIIIILYTSYNFLKYTFYFCVVCNICINPNIINNNTEYENNINNEDNINIFINESNNLNTIHNLNTIYNNNNNNNTEMLNTINYSIIQHNLTEDCVICLDNYTNNNNNIGTLQCNHYFHKECIDKWFKRSTVCPICRLGE